MGSSAAHAAATAVLPTPVGPTITVVRGGISGSPKSPLQLALGQLYDRGPAVHVVGRQCRAEQPQHELPHLLHLEPLARLDGRATGERRREALQPVGERAESPSGEIGDELLEAAPPAPPPPPPSRRRTCRGSALPAWTDGRSRPPRLPAGRGTGSARDGRRARVSSGSRPR